MQLDTASIRGRGEQVVKAVKQFSNDQKQADDVALVGFGRIS
jgi:hypothetical protein